MGLDRPSGLLKQLAYDHSVVDAGKGVQGLGGSFTLVDPTRLTRAHIDSIFLPEGWMVVKVEYTPVCFLDHCLFPDTEGREGWSA